MIHKIVALYRLETRKIVLLRILLIGLIIMIPSGLTTESLFAKVNYPHAGFGGPQATFDLEERRSEYTALIEQGTLPLFRYVQYVDFGIVIGTLLVFASLLLLIAQSQPPHSAGRRISQFGAILISLGPFMDFCENVTLLLILRSPLEYPVPLGMLNLLCTAGKTTFFILGWLIMAVGILLLIFGGLRKILFKGNIR